MKIGILGAGSVGKVLAKGWLDAGHSVKISSRDPMSESLFTWKEQMGPDCQIATFEESAAFGDVIVLAINWSGVEAVLNQTGKQALQNKVIIDLSNAVEFSETPQLALKNISAGEMIQQWLPESHVSENTQYGRLRHHGESHFSEGTPVMFLCGNDAAAKSTVQDLLQCNRLERHDRSERYQPQRITGIAHAHLPDQRDQAAGIRFCLRVIEEISSEGSGNFFRQAE